MQDFIRIHEKDNVAVALRDIPAGTRLELPVGTKPEFPAGMKPDVSVGTESDIFTEGSALKQGGIQKGKSSLIQGEVFAENGQPSQAGGLAESSVPAPERILMETEPFRREEEKAKDSLSECRDWISVTALEEIPAGHKMAIHDIPAGGEVIKYGYPIGNAREAVRAGSWVHTHNLKTALGDLLEYSYEPVFEKARERKNIGVDESGGNFGEIAISQEERSGKEASESSAPESEVCFMGFRRSDGKVGVRNEIWIIPTVGCVNSVAAAIAKQANDWLAEQAEDTAKRTVDEVIAFPHPYGCSQMGDDQEYTRKILADLINHPNAGGVLVLGLGCENSNIDVLKPYIGDYDGDRVRFLVSQECVDEVAEAVEIVKGLITYASSFQREPVSVSRLIIGMKCGGSDGLSGITANPLVGRFSDRLISQGGTTILTEVPEMFGAETILMNRCANEELFRKTVTMINDFKNYFKSHGQTIYENPSPGNKQGGISTLEDKSLGCTQKSGIAPVRGVLQYGETVQARGLNLLSAPGNDLVASTALAAAGAHIILFTTGRGTPFAAPVPTVKISTNSVLAGRKSNWIDFNAGVLAEDSGMEQETDRLFEYVVEVASGRRVCSEEAGYHDMAIFKQGVTL